MASKWYDVAEYEGPMSVAPPPMGPQPKKDISSWIKAVQNQQAQAAAEAKRIAEEQRREQERQRALAEQRAKVAAQLAKAAEARRAAAQPVQPLQVTRSGQDLTSQAPQIQASRPIAPTVPTRPQPRPIQGPQPRPQEEDRFGVSAWMPPKPTTPPAQPSQFGLGYGAGGSTPPIGPQPRPQVGQTYGQTVKGNIDFLGDTLEKWVRPANTQYQGMQENLRAERERKRAEEQALLTQPAQKPAGANESLYRPVAPTQGPGANPPGMLTPAQERKRTEIYQAGSPTQEFDAGALDRNLSRSVPGYQKTKEVATGIGKYLWNVTTNNLMEAFNAGQYLDDLWRGIGTEDTTASDVYGAIKKGLVDTVTEMGADPLTLANAQRNGTWNMASALTEDFSTRFVKNYQPALEALRESRERPSGPLAPEVEKAWDVAALLFDPEDRKQAIEAVTNKDEAIGRMQYAAGKYMARAYEPWVTADSPNAPWRLSGLTQEQWTETNAAIAADLGMKAEQLKLGNYATALEANRNIGDELISGFMGTNPLDVVAGVSKAARLTPKARAFDMVLSEFGIEPDEAVRLLRTNTDEARRLVGQQLIETNPLKQLVTQTRSSRALTQADALFRQTAFLLGLAETSEDAALLVKTLKNNPAALVTGISRDALTSPRLQALASEDGLVRFGEWAAAPRLRESQKVLQEIDDDVLDAMIPGVPVFDVAAKTEAMSNARHSFHAAAMRKYGATKGGVADDIPMGLFDARAVAAERGTFRVEFRGPSGTVVRTSEPMTKAQAEALTKRTAESGEQTRNVVQKFADVQRKIMSATYLNTRPGHWVRNALSATGHLYMDDLFSFASNAEIDSYFRRMTGGVEDVTSRLADSVGSQGEHMAGGTKKGGNILTRINQKGREVWTGDWEIPLPGGKSLPFPEGSNYRKGHYRGHREFMEEGIGRMVRNAPEELRQTPYGPVLLAGLKHAALKDGEKGIADYLAQVETFRLPFVPPASITHPMESIPDTMWNDIARVYGTAMSREEWENGLDNIFKNGMDKWQESLRRDPVAMGQRTFTKIDEAEDLNERVEEVRALGKRMGLDDQTIEAKQAEVRAAGEAQRAQTEAIRTQLHEAVAATKEPEDLMRAVDMHEDVYEVTARARETQSSLLREAEQTGGREGWMRYEKQIDEVWRNAHDEAMERMQVALDELTGKAPTKVRPPRYRLLQRLLETDEAQIAKDRQYTRQVGDWSGALQKKIDAQRATVDRALAKNSFVARQAMSADTLDEVFDMHVYLRNLSARAAAEKRAVNIAKQEAIDTLGVPPQIAQDKANVELERIWKEHTDASAAYIDTVTLSLARKNMPVDAKAILRDAEAGAKQQVPGNRGLTVDDRGLTVDDRGLTVDDRGLTVDDRGFASRQQLEDEQFALNAQIGSKVNETVTGNAKQRAAAMAEVDALNERVQAVQKQLDELPADVPAPRPATVRPQPAQNEVSSLPNEVSSLKPAAAQGTPAQAINGLRTALKDAGIEKPVDAHLVRWVNKNGELGREIKTLKEIREDEIPGLVERAQQRTAKAKRVQPTETPATVAPTVPNIKSHTYVDQYKSVTRFSYDANLVQPDDSPMNFARDARNERVRPIPGSGWDTAENVIQGWSEKSPDTIWRGMSKAEYDGIRKSGVVQSNGSLNLSGYNADGATLYATDPKSAYSYATGFAPTKNKGQIGDSTYLIQVRRPADMTINSSGEAEVVRPLSSSEIVSVYEMRAVTADEDMVPNRWLVRKAPTVAEAVPSPRPVMGNYPEGKPERQLEAAPRLLEEEDLPLLSLPEEAPLERIEKQRTELAGMKQARTNMLEQWDRAAAEWSGIPSAQSLAKKISGGGTSDLRIEGYDWQSWPKLRDFADSLLGKGATTEDVGKWLSDYALLSRQLDDVQGRLNEVKQGGESLARATARMAKEGKASDDLSKLSRREVMERHGETLKGAGYTSSELKKMNVAELKETVRTVRGDASSGWATYESTTPAYEPTGESTPLLHKWFGLEKGVDARKAYDENSEAMRRTNAASLTTADIGMYHFRQALHAHEELRKMGDDLFNPKTISRQEAMAFGQWARQQAVPQFRNTLAGANEAAKQAADFAMLNYSNTYGFDDWLSVLVPYHIYRTRTFKNTARRLMTRPDHLADFLRTERAIERNNEREGNRPRMEGRIPIPFTDGYAGMSPARYFYPFQDQLLRQSWDEEGTKELSVMERIMNGIDSAGFSPMPAIALAYQLKTGQEDEIRAVLPHTQMLIKLARAMGADVPYMKPNVGTRLLGLTDDWDADRLVRGMGVLQQEGKLNLTDSQAAWLRDTIAIKTGKAQGPLPEMPDGMEPFFQQVEARAMGDDNVRTLSNFFLGLGVTRQPESERQIYRDMNNYFGMQYDPVENPFGSRGEREPTPATQTMFDRKFFYPNADPDVKRPGIGAATGDFYDERRLLVDQREADIERLFATNPDATYEEEQAIYSRFKEQEAALKARYPSADLKPPTGAVKSGMNPMEGKNAMFGEFLNWFEFQFPGKPTFPEDAGWAATVKYRQDVAAWEAKRTAALAGIIGQAGLGAFLKGGTPEQALDEYRRSEMTEAEGRVKSGRRAESQEKTAVESAMIGKYGPNVFAVMEGSIGLKGAEWRAYHDKYPWLNGAWDEYNKRKAANAEKDNGAYSLQGWLGRFLGKPDEINALFDGAKYGVEKDKNGTLVAKGPATGEGKPGAAGSGEDDPLRGLKDAYYAFDKDDWDGKCAYLHSDEGAPLLAAWTEKYPDGWFVGCQSGGGGRSYGRSYGGGGYFVNPPQQAYIEGMNPELWDLRGVPQYYAPEDRTRFWLAAGDRIGPEQLRAWTPPR